VYLDKRLRVERERERQTKDVNVLGIQTYFLVKVSSGDRYKYLPSDMMDTKRQKMKEGRWH